MDEPELGIQLRTIRNSFLIYINTSTARPGVPVGKLGEKPAAGTADVKYAFRLSLDERAHHAQLIGVPQSLQHVRLHAGLVIGNGNLFNNCFYVVRGVLHESLYGQSKCPGMFKKILNAG